jgi:hypothetical protein
VTHEDILLNDEISRSKDSAVGKDIAHTYDTMLDQSGKFDLCCAADWNLASKPLAIWIERMPTPLESSPRMLCVPKYWHQCPLRVV